MQPFQVQAIYVHAHHKGELCTSRTGVGGIYACSVLSLGLETIFSQCPSLQCKHQVSIAFTFYLKMRKVAPQVLKRKLLRGSIGPRRPHFELTEMQQCWYTKTFVHIKYLSVAKSRPCTTFHKGLLAHLVQWFTNNVYFTEMQIK